ncbi:hypothetical protein BaRGS_00005335, partial [Batillaria attramentaria]
MFLCLSLEVIVCLANLSDISWHSSAGTPHNVDPFPPASARVRRNISRYHTLRVVLTHSLFCGAELVSLGVTAEPLPGIPFDFSVNGVNNRFSWGSGLVRWFTENELVLAAVSDGPALVNWSCLRLNLVDNSVFFQRRADRASY